MPPVLPQDLSVIRNKNESNDSIKITPKDIGHFFCTLMKSVAIKQNYLK